GEVAVKVMRAGVRRALRTDLLFLRSLAAILDTLGVFRSYGLRDFADEMCRMTERELSFVTEATYIEELRSLMLKDDTEHYAPKVYADYSKERVMVLEWLHGIWVSEMLEAVEAAREGDQLAVTLL
ncbi:MAG: hypothetical protein GWO24_12600, partial [Akkermansiaceae bacterium]|nr:hypothetical protein [Akkermansiaceae bacterium]